MFAWTAVLVVLAGVLWSVGVTAVVCWLGGMSFLHRFTPIWGWSRKELVEKFGEVATDEDTDWTQHEFAVSRIAEAGEVARKGRGGPVVRFVRRHAGKQLGVAETREQNPEVRDRIRAARGRLRGS